MSRYRVLLLLLAITVGGAVSSGRPLWWSIAGALAALIAVSLAWAFLSLAGLRLQRHTLTRVAQAGQLLDEEFILSNLSLVPKLWVEVRDESTLPGHAASRVTGIIGARSWRGWRVTTLCRERGRFNLGPVTALSGDPLGVFQMQRRLAATSAILVYPATFDFPQFPLPGGYLPGGDARHRRTHDVTTNAAGVRDYMAGDGINRIHWPISVKRQRLIVKEFELDPMSDLWVVIDMQRAAHVAAAGPSDSILPPSTEEYAVSMAASVARHFLQQDRAIGLIAYGQHREVVACDRGERQYTKIMEVLSVIQAQGEVPFHRVLRAETASLARGSTLIAISPSFDAAWAITAQHIVRSGLRVVAILIDAESFGGPAGSAPMIGALAEAGAVTRLLRLGDQLPAVL